MFFLCAIDLILFGASAESREDHRADLCRLERVADADRNRVIDRRLDRFWMQDLGSEIGKLGGFFIRKNRDRPRVAADSRVAGHHAGHVGPDLQLARIERGRDQRRRIIRASASQASSFRRRGCRR